MKYVKSIIGLILITLIASFYFLGCVSVEDGSKYEWLDGSEKDATELIMGAWLWEGKVLGGKSSQTIIFTTDGRCASKSSDSRVPVKYNYYSVNNNKLIFEGEAETTENQISFNKADKKNKEGTILKLTYPNSNYPFIYKKVDNPTDIDWSNFVLEEMNVLTAGLFKPSGFNIHTMDGNDFKMGGSAALTPGQHTFVGSWSSEITTRKTSATEYTESYSYANDITVTYNYLPGHYYFVKVDFNQPRTITTKIVEAGVNPFYVPSANESIINFKLKQSVGFPMVLFIDGETFTFASNFNHSRTEVSALNLAFNVVPGEHQLGLEQLNVNHIEPFIVEPYAVYTFVIDEGSGKIADSKVERGPWGIWESTNGENRCVFTFRINHRGSIKQYVGEKLIEVIPFDFSFGNSKISIVGTRIRRDFNYMMSSMGNEIKISNFAIKKNEPDREAVFTRK